MEQKQSAELQSDRELNPEVAARRNALFDQYITPYFYMIRYLVKRYSASPKNIKENYTLVLTTLFRGIETYNPQMEIKTWIHICTKRCVIEHERRRAVIENQRDYDHDVSYFLANDCFGCDDLERPSSNSMDEHNYRQFYSDDVLEALDSLNPIHKDALILQMAGYSLKEIAAIEYKKGRLESQNIDTVKSRLFLARQTLMKKLNRNGTRRTNKTA